MKHSPAYIAGRLAYFDGYNPHDVEKFYSDGSPDALDWMKGLTDAKSTAEVMGVPRGVFRPHSRLDITIVDPNWKEDLVGNHCLVVKGGNPNNLKDLVAYVDNVPRVRIRPIAPLLPGMDPAADPEIIDQLNWVARGSPVLNDDDAHARHWCDVMIVMLGYTFAVDLRGRFKE